MIKSIATAAALALAALGLAVPAAAETRDIMYKVGDGDGMMPVGEYQYVVTDEWGSFYLCLDARCQGDGIYQASGVIDGNGNTGYFEVVPGLSFVKLHNLRAYPTDPSAKQCPSVRDCAPAQGAA